MYFFYAIVSNEVIIILIFLLKARQSENYHFVAIYIHIYWWKLPFRCCYRPRNYHWSKNLSSNCSNRFNIGLQLTNILLILRVIIISTSFLELKKKSYKILHGKLVIILTAGILLWYRYCINTSFFSHE